MSVELTEAGASTFVGNNTTTGTTATVHFTVDEPGRDSRPPRDELVRCMPIRLEYRGSGDGGTLEGHFAVFNEWTEIDSMFEGHFLERIAPGAFKKTFREQVPKVLFNHGHDQMLGDKLLGRVDQLKEDDIGAAYEVGLYRGLPEYLIDGLRDGAYGASFRFRVIKEDFDQRPEESADNPDGLPERTIREAQVMEFGPVTFPAYATATAKARMVSGTDEELITRAIEHSERFGQVLDHVRTVVGVRSEAPEAPDEPEGDEPQGEPVEEPVQEVEAPQDEAPVEPGDDEPTPEDVPTDEGEQPDDESTDPEPEEPDDDDALQKDEPVVATTLPRSREEIASSFKLPEVPNLAPLKNNDKEWHLP